MTLEEERAVLLALRALLGESLSGNATFHEARELLDRVLAEREGRCRLCGVGAPGHEPDCPNLAEGAVNAPTPRGPLRGSPAAAAEGSVSAKARQFSALADPRRPLQIGASREVARREGRAKGPI